MRPPKNPIHPGEILLEEFLRPAGETQAAFASRIGWTRARFNELIRGKRGVTADAALDLADALGTSSKIWMNLQATWDLAAAARRRRAACTTPGIRRGLTATKMDRRATCFQSGTKTYRVGLHRSSPGR